MANFNAFTGRTSFSFRATDVGQLTLVDDPIGPDNDYYIQEVIEEADILVPCWGSRQKIPPSLQPRLDAMIEILLQSGKPVKCFGLTASLDPIHPLMLPYSTELIVFRPKI